MTNPCYRVTDPMCRWVTRRSARILMYHRFWWTGERRRVSAEGFEAQMRYIRDHFTPIRLSSLVSQLRSGRPLSPSQVVITVDDGYADFGEIAYPILRRYKIPATIFIVSRFADQAIWLWFDALRYAIRHAAPGRRVLAIPHVAHAIALDGPESRAAVWNELGDACLTLTPAERLEASARIAEALEVVMPARPIDEFRGMTWDEIRSFDPELIEIGSHTCSHPVLSRCTDDEVETELVESRRVIEREIGRPVVSFSYPNGQCGDYDERVIRHVREAGYENAVVAHGSFIRQNANPFRLERIGPYDEPSEFHNLVNGYPDLVGRAKRRAPRLAWQ